MKKLSQPPVFCLALLILDEKGNCTFLLCHGLGLGFVSVSVSLFLCFYVSFCNQSWDYGHGHVHRVRLGK